MNPFNILGWILVIIVSIPILSAALTLIIGCGVLAFRGISRRILYLRTRNTPLATGQRWWQNGDVLKVGKLHDKGHFTITSGNASWGETSEEWKVRVRNRKLFLISQ